MNRISLYNSGETTGSPADRVYSSKRMETTGGVGEKPVQVDSAKVDKTPECDTVCFRGKEVQEKKGTSFLGGLMMTVGAAALVIGGLGCAHKYKVLDRLNEGKLKEILSKSEPVLNTCHEWCAKVKGLARQGYEKVASLFKKKS